MGGCWLLAMAAGTAVMAHAGGPELLVVGLVAQSFFVASVRGPTIDSGLPRPAVCMPTRARFLLGHTGLADNDQADR